MLLAHLGGPFWAAKDDGAWTAPKGVVEPGELPLAAAAREFREETGLPSPALGDAIDLGVVRQPTGKRVRLWAVEADVDTGAFTPGTFRMEWPPRTGRMIDVPEVDALRWFDLGEAEEKLVAGQRAFLDRLLGALR